MIQTRINMQKRWMSPEIKIHFHSLLHDRDFVDYCRKEIHDIVKDGKIDMNDIQHIINIIHYIITIESKRSFPKEIYMDVLEAFIIELLQRYGIQITDDMYETMVKCIENIIHNKTCNPSINPSINPSPKRSNYFSLYSIL